MRRYLTYIRVSTSEQSRSGLGLEAQPRDIDLFPAKYSEVPWENLGISQERQAAADHHAQNSVGDLST